MFTIETMNGIKRMSTQELLQAINDAVAAGETEFYIQASGQHDLGGPLWHPEGKTLRFHINNPGQRVGSMCLPGTEIIVEGPSSADVGWLNAGGKIVVKGDSGDTAGHCAANGKIFIGGRAGTRTGSLMKHDPCESYPELWVLKNCGSFSFEFMSGGVAVVCGYDSEHFESVLGNRSCVGMVGGKLYARGPVQGISKKDVKIELLNDADIRYLAANMDDFLISIDRYELKSELTNWEEWRKISPLTYDERPKKASINIRSFRLDDWVPQGIFNDVVNDDYTTLGLVNKAAYRLRVPIWENASYSAPCEFFCKASIPTQQRYNLLREHKLEEAYRLVLEYTPFPASVCGAVCPNPCMDGCSRSELDGAVRIGDLGRYSSTVKLPKPTEQTDKHVAIIGGGVAGLTAAWHLIRRGHRVTVYDEAKGMGGKLEQVIPRNRLAHGTLLAELKRIEEMGVEFCNGSKVDRGMFHTLSSNHDAVIIATGAHVSRLFPWPGQERIVKGLDFLKAINRGEKPSVGRRVIVIGCGNSGMDAAVGAYQMGAEQVVCIDIQKPAAFAKEIDHVEELGGVLLWPVATQAVTAEGIITTTGELIPGDTVIITVGETPDLTFLPDGIPLERGCLKPDDQYRITGHIFTAGDTIKAGTLVEAIGSGREAALSVDAFLQGKEWTLPVKTLIPAERLQTAYFTRWDAEDLPGAESDHQRCISCGTCRDCHMCHKSCPEQAIIRVAKGDGSFEYISDEKKCIGCGICAGICPCGIWVMAANGQPIGMYRPLPSR